MRPAGVRPRARAHRPPRCRAAAGAGQRLVLECALDLALGPVVLGIEVIVADEALGHRLEQVGAPAVARVGDRPGADGLHRLDVVAVDAIAGHPVGGGPLEERLGADHRRDRRQLGVDVVLDDDYKRQSVDRGEVQRLVDAPLVHRAVADRDEADRAVAHVLRGKRGARRDRDSGADDRVLAEQAVCRGGEVGGAAPAAAERRAPPHQLGEQVRGGDAPREYPAVPAVGDGERVALLEHAAGPDRDSLLTAAEVHRPLDQPVGLQLEEPLLEPANRGKCRVCVSEIQNEPCKTFFLGLFSASGVRTVKLQQPRSAV